MVCATDSAYCFAKLPNSIIGEYFFRIICPSLSVAQTMNQKVAVSDRDQIIAVAGGGKRELLGKTISRQLEEMIINRENSIQAGLDKKTIPLISGDEDSYSAQAIYPICCEGDCIGAVILYSRENQTHFSETEYKAAACAASFLGKQMEG